MTIHQTCQAAQAAACPLCGPGPCACEGTHLARIARARAGQLITAGDFASVIADADVFTGTTVVIDPEVTP